MSSGNEKLCFVLMPFKKELEAVYTNAIKPACDKASFKAIRADELKGPYNIHRDIIKHIFLSHAVVADLTDKNPNVFYEMGVAHAIANKTIMIIQNGEKPPFDIVNYRCIFYDLSESGQKLLTYRIAEYLEDIDEWRKDPTNPVQDFKPYEPVINKLSIDETGVAISTLQKEIERLRTESVPKSEMEITKKILETNERERKSLHQKLEHLQKNLSQKQSEIFDLTRKLNRLHSESVPKIDVESLQKAINEKEQALRKKDELLAQSIPRVELGILLNRLLEKQANNSALQKELENLVFKISELVKKGGLLQRPWDGLSDEQKSEKKAESQINKEKFVDSKQESLSIGVRGKKLTALTTMATHKKITVAAAVIILIAIFFTVILIVNQKRETAIKDSLLFKGNECLKNNLFDCAEKSFRQILSMDPTHQQAQKGLTNIEKRLEIFGDSAFVNKQYWAATGYYQSAHNIKQNQDIKKKLSQCQAEKNSVLVLKNLRNTEKILSEKSVESMLKERGFYHYRFNNLVKPKPHLYEAIKSNGEKLIIDHTSGLTWQNSVSDKPMSYNDADTYINALNKKAFGGYTDWRLPTLEEAMSLIQVKMINDSTIASIHPDFDKTRYWIWTKDKDTAEILSVWVVYLFKGTFETRFNENNSITYVRAVR